MFGDGASNTGNFGETMNLAALWRLPVVFILENNLYGMGTSVERHSAVTDFSKKAEGMGVPGRARRRHGRAGDARDRRRAHPDRPRGAPADAGRGVHLPLPRPLRRRPRGLPDQGGGRGVAQEGPDRGLRRPARGRGRAQRPRPATSCASGSRRRIIEAVEFADASPEPPLDTLYDHLYVVGDQVPGWYAVDERAPQPFAGEREGEELTGEAKRLAEAGAAYGGQAASTAGRARGRRPARRPGGRRRARGPRGVRRRGRRGDRGAW